MLAAGALLASIGVVELALRPFEPELSSRWMLGSPARVVDAHAIVVAPQLLDPATYEIDPDLPTLVALGDSFTQGHPLGDDAGYPSRLGRILRAAGRPMNVLKIGQGDTGPDQQLRIFTRYVLTRVRPDVVVWQLYSNDVADNVYKATYTIRDGALVELDARRSWLYRRQRLFDAIPLPVPVKRQSRIVELLMRALERQVGAEAPVELGGAPEHWALEKIRLAIEEMQRLSHAHGFQLWVALVVPQFFYLDSEKERVSGEAADGRWRRDLAALFELASAYPGFVPLYAGGGPGWRRIFEDGTRDTNPFGSRHFSEHGYRWMAATVAAHVLAAPLRDVAPAAHNATGWRPRKRARRGVIPSAASVR
jgi:hypothetical protein